MEEENTNNIIEIATALSKAQGEMTGAKKDKINPFFKSSYADLSSIFDAIREPFFNNDLSITQPIDILPDGRQIIRTHLLHKSGESIKSVMILPNEPSPQKLGSLITYYRRYALMSIAGISSEDDDGNEASTPTPKSSSKKVNKPSNPVEQPKKIEFSKVNGFDEFVQKHELDRDGDKYDYIKDIVSKGKMKRGEIINYAVDNEEKFEEKFNDWLLSKRESQEIGENIEEPTQLENSQL